MKRSLITFLLLMLTAAIASAQADKKVSFGIFMDVPFNTGVHNFTQQGMLYQDGLGGSLRLEGPITPKLHFKLSAGYMSYHSNVNSFIIPLQNSNNASEFVNPNIYGDYKLAPLKAGLQYYFWRFLYVNGMAGESIRVNSKVNSSFIYSGGVGSVITLDRHSSFDISCDYGTAFKIAGFNYSINELGLRIGYKFRF